MPSECDALLADIKAITDAILESDLAPTTAEKLKFIMAVMKDAVDD